MGGSIALALKQAARADKIIFIDHKAAYNEMLIQKGFQIGTYADIAAADLLILAVPVQQVSVVLKEATAFIHPALCMMDVASTKVEVIKEAEIILGENFAHFIPSHPIAGNEKAGFTAAEAGLFQNQPVVLTPLAMTQPEKLNEIRLLWQALGATVVEMTPTEHDLYFARYSHLPNILSFVLSRQGQYEPRLRQDLLPPSFKSMTRLAKSDAQMWQDICLSNQTAILTMLERFEKDLYDFKTRLQNADSQQILHYFMMQPD